MTVTVERSISELPVKLRAIAAGGADFTQYGYATKFTARKAILTAAIRAGWTFEDCYRAFLADPTLPTYELWASGRSDIGQHGRLKRLQEDYAQAYSYVAATPAPVTNAAGARARVAELMVMAAGAAWTGVAGRTDRDVLAVLHRYAREAGSLTVLAPTRNVALDAGVSRPTSHRSMGRLIKTGWLAKERKAESWLTGRYTVTSPGVLHSETYQDSEALVHSMSQNATAHETWAMLGKSGHAVWLALDSQPRSLREIGSRAGVHYSTAQRNLKRLASYGLAMSNGDGWTIGTATPEEVATANGFDIVAKRIAQYAEERAAWDKQAQLDDAANDYQARKKSHTPDVPEGRSEHIEIHQPDPFISEWNREAYRRRDVKAKAA